MGQDEAVGMINTLKDKELAALYQQGYAFALFKAPEQPPKMLLQKGAATKLQSLSEVGAGHSGFIFAPFAPKENSPVLLIEPEHSATGAEEIVALVRDTLKECASASDAADVAAANAVVSSSTTTNFSFSSTASSLSTPANAHSGAGSLQVAVHAGAGAANEQGSFAALQERWGELAGSFADYQRYCQSFVSCMEQLQAGPCSKVVLSRSQQVQLPPDFSLLSSWVHACKKSKNMMVTLVATPQSGLWLGSSPELLLYSHLEQCKTIALAGTMANPKPESSEELPLSLWSEKNKKEQQVVADYIEVLLKQYAQEYTLKGPWTKSLGTVVHLQTDFTFTLKPEVNVGDFLAALHPTPAICGLPKERAFALLQHSENYDRSYYAGVLGPVNLDQSSQLFVNLRCMQLNTTPIVSADPAALSKAAVPLYSSATLYAGGGIIVGSEMQDEFNETCLKMSMLSSLWQRAAANIERPAPEL